MRRQLDCNKSRWNCRAHCRQTNYERPPAPLLFPSQRASGGYRVLQIRALTTFRDRVPDVFRASALVVGGQNQMGQPPPT